MLRPWRQFHFASPHARRPADLGNKQSTLVLEENRLGCAVPAGRPLRHRGLACPRPKRPCRPRHRKQSRIGQPEAARGGSGTPMAACTYLPSTAVPFEAQPSKSRMEISCSGVGVGRVDGARIMAWAGNQVKRGSLPDCSTLSLCQFDEMQRVDEPVGSTARAWTTDGSAGCGSR